MKPTDTTAAPPTPPALLSEVRQLIDSSRQQLATAVNSTLTLLYWNIGRRIRSEVLQNERAAYGEQIVSTLSRQLSWTHFKTLIYIDDPLKRDFYLQMCQQEGWSTRTLLNGCAQVARTTNPTTGETRDETTSSHAGNRRADNQIRKTGPNGMRSGALAMVEGR
jgi:hypothetical protein